MLSIYRRINHSRNRASIKRDGAALVEFAVCLPVLVLIVLGSIEATSAVFVRQSLVVAAYEAAREAVRRDGTSTDAEARAREVLDQRKINSARITITPANLANVQRGSEVTVQIVAGMQENSPFFAEYFPTVTFKSLQRWYENN